MPSARLPRPAAPALLWVAFFLLSAIWGSSYFFIKIAVATVPPFTLVAERLLMGTLFLGGWLLLSGTRLVGDRATLARLAVLSLANVAIPFVLIAWSEQHIASALTTILNSTVPLFSGVIAALFLHDEPITLNRLAGLVVGFAGVVLVFGGDLAAAGAPQGSLQLAAELAVVLASLSYAGATVFARKALRGLSPVQIALPQLAGAASVAWAGALLLDRPAGGAPIALPTTPEAAFAIAWLGILGSAVAYLLFFRLVTGWGATRTTLVTYLMPVVGVTLGVTVLHETLDPPALAGTALILLGIVLVSARVGARRLFGGASVPPSVPRPATATVAEPTDRGTRPPD